jgi:hypothetical protein
VAIDDRSAAKLNKSPRSDGFIGAASTFIKTSSADGIGNSAWVIESSILPSLVTLERISFDIFSDILFPILI